MNYIMHIIIINLPISDVHRFILAMDERMLAHERDVPAYWFEELWSGQAWEKYLHRI